MLSLNRNKVWFIFFKLGKLYLFYTEEQVVYSCCIAVGNCANVLYSASVVQCRIYSLIPVMHVGKAILKIETAGLDIKKNLSVKVKSALIMYHSHNC